MPKSASNSAQGKTTFFYHRKKTFFKEKQTGESAYFLSQEMPSKELFVYQELIQQEFNDLSSVFDTMTVEQTPEQFFCFALYCCYLLRDYHAACGHYYQQQSYHQKAKQLIYKLNRVANANNKKERKRFLELLSQTFYETRNDLKHSLLNPGRFSDNIGLINLLRLVLILSRLSLSQLFILLEEKNILKKLAQFLHRDLSAAQLIKRMSVFNGVFNALSVGVFGLRLLRNVAATLYFTISPPTKEAKEALGDDWTKRLKHQLYQRKGALLNDSVWTVINGVTNYQLFGLSAFAAMGITAGFVFFDVCVLLYLKHCEEKIYVKKQEQYWVEYNDLLEKWNNLSNGQEKKPLLNQLNFIKKQIICNGIHWQQKSATYDFQIFACLMLGAGLGFSILVSSPVVIFFCYVACALAVSMLLSGSEYGTLKAIKAKRDNAKVFSLDAGKLDEQYQKAKLSLAVKLIKDTLMPSILIGTCLLCWQAALVVLVAYAAVEGVRYYKKHKEDNAPEGNSSVLLGNEGGLVLS